MRGSPCVAALVLLGACVIDDLRYEDRFCAADWPCAEGYRCVSNHCVSAPGGDGPTVDRAISDARGDPVSSDLDSGHADGPHEANPASDLCPAGTKLCGGSCVDTQTSSQHCGDCKQPCPSSTTSGCVAGQCRCGSQLPCTAGLNCVGGSCTCLVGTGSVCPGCCDKGACVDGTQVGACGLGGVACQMCFSLPCRQATCATGSCGTSNLPDGTACPGGLCRSGLCCTGCWLIGPQSCVPGTSPAACGLGGVLCAACGTKNCVGGNCL